MPYEDIIEKHFKRVGLDPALGRKVMKIESGGDTYNVTGSYRGLFQLSHGEFKRHGGSGSIHDPEQNTMAAANKLAQQSRDFKEKYGRDPKPIDIYMIHQQGEGGYAKHLENPDRPAWQNMAATGEGKAKGEAWAKQAIWGNIPDKDKAKFGSVENVTSNDFVNKVWASRVEGGEAEFGGGITVRGRPVGGKKGGRAVGEAGEKPGTEPGDLLGAVAKAGTILGSELEDYGNIKMPQFGDLVPRFSLGRMKVPG